MEASFKVLRKKILARADKEIYLVGGAVRDLYLGREVTDYDFAYAGNALQLTQDLALGMGATFVPLDVDHDIARLVYKSNAGNIHLDFAGFKGADITEDLNARDFTINALAIPLKEGFPEIYDPLGGVEDINSKRISAISEANLMDDPLRILRAVRLAVELGYSIDPVTFKYMLNNKNFLTKISSERIRDEVFKAFTSNAYETALLLDALGFFDLLIPELAATKGVVQNKYHTLDVWEHSLAALKQLEQDVLVDTSFLLPEIKEYLTDQPVPGRSRKTLLKFAALLHDIGKPVVRQLHEKKGVTFWNHDLVGSDMGKAIATRFALANKEIVFIQKIIKYHMRPLFLSKEKPSPKALYKFFYETGEDGLGIILHAMADTKGGKKREPEQLQNFLAVVGTMRDFYIQEYLPKKRLPLLGGGDVLALIPKIPEYKVGEVLKSVAEAYTNGKISTREEAIIYIKNKYRHYETHLI